jgi:PAS domain S-box-containing protein
MSDAVARAPRPAAVARRVDRIEDGARRTVVTVAGLGLAVLAAWIVDVPAHLSPPIVDGMQPTAALCLVLAGGAFCLLGRRTRPVLQLAGRAVAIAVAGLAAVGLIHLLTGSAHGATAAPRSALEVLDPARLSPLVALAFLLAGCAIAALREPRLFRIAQLGGLGAAAIGVATTVGSAYSAPRVAEVLGLTGSGEMSLPTAVAFALIGLSVVACTPGRGVLRILVEDSPAGTLAWRLLPLAVGLPLAIGWLQLLGLRRGWFGVKVSEGFVTVVVAAGVVGAIYHAARVIHRAECRRRRAEGRVRGSARGLELRVRERTADLENLNRDLAASERRLRHSTDRLRELERLNRLVSASLDLGEVLGAIARAAAGVVAAPGVVVWLAHADGNQLVVGAFSDPLQADDYGPTTTRVGAPGAGEVAARGSTVRIADVLEAGLDPRRVSWCRRHGFKSFFGAPIVFRHVLVGVIGIYMRAPAGLSRDEEERFASFIDQAAVAIGNARQYQASETRRRVAEALAEMSRLTAETLDLERIALRLGERLRLLLDCAIAGVYELEPRSGALVLVARSRAAEVQFDWSARLEPTRGVVGLAAELGTAVDTPDFLADARVVGPPEWRRAFEKSVHRAVLAVPLTAHGTVVGVLAVGDRTGRTYSPEAVALAQAFADQAGLALANARLFQESESRRVAAENAEGRYRTLFERVPVGLYRARTDGEVLEANPALVRLLGYPDLETLKAVPAVDHYVDPDDRERLLALAAREAGVATLDMRLRRGDGRVIWVSNSTRAVRDAQGVVVAIEGAIEDITERRAAESHRASLREKEVLLKEIHHRVKNNMQVVSSLLSLQRAALGEPRAERALLESENRVRVMALIHEKLYSSGDLSRLDMGEYVRSLVAALEQSYVGGRSRVTLRVEVDACRLGLETAIPCGLVLNELVANSLEHAFPHGRGTVEISLRTGADDTGVLTVRDDGVGLPAGIAPGQSPSLGLRLVGMLAEQIGGTVAVGTEGGTSVSVRFPMGREGEAGMLDSARTGSGRAPAVPITH